MKLTIKSNGTINGATVYEWQKKNGEKLGIKKIEIKKEINAIEIDFTPPDIWSDFELWLEDDNGQQLDYKKMITTNRKRLKMR